MVFDRDQHRKNAKSLLKNSQQLQRDLFRETGNPKSPSLPQVQNPLKLLNYQTLTVPTAIMKRLKKTCHLNIESKVQHKHKELKAMFRLHLDFFSVSH